MWSPLLRLLAFAGLSAVFASAAWIVEIGNVNSPPLPASAILADLTVGTVPSGGSSGGALPSSINVSPTTNSPKLPPSPSDNTNKTCLPEDSTRGYKPGAGKYPAKYCAPPKIGLGPVTNGQIASAVAATCSPPNVWKTNYYGKPCTFTWQKLVVKGRCVADLKCDGLSYTGQDKDEHYFGDTSEESMKEWMAQWKKDNPNPTQLVCLGPCDAPASTPGTQAAQKQAGSLQPRFGEGSINTDAPSRQPPVSAKPSTPAQTPNQTSAWQGIQAAANTENPSGGSQGGSSARSQQTFRSSPILGNIANWAFGPSTGSGQGSGGSSGGTVAYAPQGDPGYYNRNFEATDAQVTFPEAQPSPDQIIAYLAQNSKRQQGDKVTAAELKERGILNAGILEAINRVVTPVGDFISSIFTSEEKQKLSGEEVSAAAREKKPPLERGRLVLTLSADDSLVPGDPTSIANLPRPQYEAFESIPESSRAWVQTSPRAGEGIEGIASAPPTYGWGEQAQDAGDSPVAEGGKVPPEVSDVPFEPFFPRFGSAPEMEEGSTEPPRSLFSAMGKSFETIGEAVGSLFSNIGKSLFWWL